MNEFCGNVSINSFFITENFVKVYINKDMLFVKSNETILLGIKAENIIQITVSKLRIPGGFIIIHKNTDKMNMLWVNVVGFKSEKLLVNELLNLNDKILLKKRLTLFFPKSEMKTIFKK